MKPKVLLIQEILQRYRAPIYKLMSKEVDLDLAYTDKNDIDDTEFNIFRLPHFKLWKFDIQNLKQVRCCYNATTSKLPYTKLCTIPTT